MVVVDNVDALQTWLVKKLTPICDADPQALAKYVVALVKKDKSENNLKALCKDQLDVFLQKESEPFVSELFDALHTQCYLPSSQPSETRNNAPQRPPEQDPKRRVRDTRRYRSSRSRSPGRRPRGPEGRRYDDRRYRRTPPGQRRRYGRVPRMRTPSPRRRDRSSDSPGLRKRLRSRSPRRSRSPVRRRESNSCERSSSSSSSPSSPSESSNSVDEKKREVTIVDKPKERCWDYNEKGFCIKGDLCPYDHGTDAVVVNDLAVTNPTSATDTPTSQADTSNGQTKVEDPTPAPVQAPPFLPPHPILQNLPIRFPFPPPPIPLPPVPPPALLQRLTLPLGINMPPMPVPPPNLPPPPGYNPEDPALNKLDPNRSELLRKRPAEGNTGNEPKNKKTYFNNSSGSYNKTIIVKKIPAILNNITKLNEHFAKFGAINNIQVKYSSHPNEALVEYAHVSSARMAMRDTEPILNNRFIRVFWHNNNNNTPDSTSQSENEQTESSVQYNPSSSIKSDENKHTTSKVKEKVTTVEKLTEATEASAVENKKETLVVSSTLLAAEKKAMLEASIEAQKKILAARETLRQKTRAKQKLVQQKKLELQKQRQGLMQKQIEEQKILLAKLNANRDLPTSEKMEILKTLKALTGSYNSVRNLANNNHSQKNNEVSKQKLDADTNRASTNTDSIFALKRKLNQLKSEAGSLGIVPPSRGGWKRGRGRGRGRGHNPHRFIRAGANLDRRSSELTISGFADTEKDEMISHLADFGEIESFTYDEGGACILKYKSRSSAEQALIHGSFFKGKSLSIGWMTSVTKSTTTPVTSSPKTTASHSNNFDSVVDEKEKILEPVTDRSEASYIPASTKHDDPPNDGYGYGILDEELDEEALLAGGDLDDEDDDDDVELRSWKT